MEPSPFWSQATGTINVTKTIFGNSAEEVAVKVEKGEMQPAYLVPLGAPIGFTFQLKLDLDGATP